MEDTGSLLQPSFTASTTPSSNRIIMRESWLIAAVGIADLATTLYWVGHHGAEEANPIFNLYLSMGAGWFAIVKLIMLAMPIVLLEYARRRKPKVAHRGAQFAFCAYIGLYGLGVAKLNPDIVPLQPEPEVQVARGMPEYVVDSLRPRGQQVMLLPQP
jgi:tellurite resistance protein TehA-like permease